MTKTDRNIFFSALAVVVLATSVCFLFFGDIILHPGEFLFGADGDALKNYFSVAYQVIHGDGMWFSGMLYPYGDNLQYADGQPLLTKVLSWFIDPNVDNGTQVIAAMNLLMIFSLVLTAWCVHRLLVWNMVHPWFAVPFSLVIAFLSPQMARFGGHYALAYSFYVPAVWLLISGIYLKSHVWVWTSLFVAFTLLFGFIQPYYVFISTLFFGAIMGWEIVLNKFQFGQIKNLLAKAVGVFFPVIIFLLYQKSINTYTDRPCCPGGTLSFTASLRSVFVPVKQSFYNLINGYFSQNFEPPRWEGHAYLGLVPALLILASLVILIKRIRFRKSKLITHPVLPSVLRISFIPAIITLLFAMGVFHHLGLSWLSEYISPIKQFRSLGRMAWIFYYVFTIWAVFHLWVLYRRMSWVNKGGRRFLAILLPTLCLFVWTLDVVVNLQSTAKGMTSNRSAHDSFSGELQSEWTESGIDLSEYQAILALPLTVIGSEKIGSINGNRAMNFGLQSSFSTGLPLFGGMMSRMSLNVAEKSIQLKSDPLIRKTILDDLKSEREILILWSNEKLSPEEFELIQLAEPIYDGQNFRLFSILPSTIKKQGERSRKNILAMDITDTNSPYRKPAQFEKNKEKLWGAPTYRTKRYNVILDSTFETTDTLILSYWLKVDPATELLPERVLSQNGKWVYSGGVASFPNVLDGWLLVSDVIITKANIPTRYALNKISSIIARVQLRRLGTNVLHQEQNLRFFNNIPVK
ncbi:MAG: hypothetical protein JKX84_00785 [Flavobacteriales bacterium]|nr:hypothetical protein [Flavobacteriales bacterium]